MPACFMWSTSIWVNIGRISLAKLNACVSLMRGGSPRIQVVPRSADEATGMVFLRALLVTLLLAMVPTTGYFAGPARAGQSVMYEIVTTTGDEPQGARNF